LTALSRQDWSALGDAPRGKTNKASKPELGDAEHDRHDLHPHLSQRYNTNMASEVSVIETEALQARVRELRRFL